ncbi:MAG: TrkA C-terminal domain-containing protein, partial [Brachymonas denitrificans]
RNLDALRAAGATEVVPEAIEGSLMLAGHALALVGIPMRRVLRTVQQQREQRYRLLRGYFRGANEELQEDDSEYEKLETLVLPEGLQCLGQTVDDLRPLLDRFNVHLVSVRRSTGTSLSPRGDLILEPGDTLVLSGKQVDLAEVEDALSH